MEEAMCTIVSAFVPTCNHVEPERYINWGQKLVDVPVKKIIFTPAHIIKMLHGNPDTQFVPFNMVFPPNLEEMQLPASRNQEKDTAKYMWLMHQKVDFCKRAIALDPFHSAQFVWLDFGLIKVCEEATFSRDVVRLSKLAYGQVRIAAIWPFSYRPPPSYGDGVLWYLAGGVFGGDKQSLLRFAELVLHELAENPAKLTWEVNTWWKILQKHPSLFSPFRAEHDARIIREY